ncbi:putative kinetochore protein spc24 [Aspergillus unguis]
MLLDENPSTLIHHTIGNFNIAPDKQAVSRINDSLGTLQQSRDLRMREAESSLRKLSRHLQSLNNQHEEAVAAHDASKHAGAMVELDTKKFRVAKAASELEIESERLESELDMLKERLADLEAQGLEGDETTRREREADDAILYSFTLLQVVFLANDNRLRLKIYRALGIDIEPDEAGNFTKAVIRNSRKGDVHVVNLDPKFSRFFYSNYFWSTMQG